MIEHLFPSEVDVHRLTLTDDNGRGSYDYECVGQVRCRLDLQWTRPGIDFVPPVEAGRVPDRVGVCFLPQGADVKSSDRLKCLSGPVTGVFEVMANPDTAQDFASAHHKEVQVREVAQAIA